MKLKARRFPSVRAVIALVIGGGVLLSAPQAACAQADSLEETAATRRFRISLNTLGLGLSYDLTRPAGTHRPIISLYGESFFFISGAGLSLRTAGNRYGGAALGVYSMLLFHSSLYERSHTTIAGNTLIGGRVFAGWQSPRKRTFGEVGIGYLGGAATSNGIYPHLAIGWRY